MENKITVQFHHLGPIILVSSSDFLTKQGDFFDVQRHNLAVCLDIKPADLTTEIVERYIEVTPKDSHPTITPSYKKLNERITEPLRAAKKAYCFEDYVTSIALSGIVGEMMAHIFFQMKTTNINGEILNSDGEKALFGKGFDALGQFRRIQILTSLGYITSSQKTQLENIQNNRRPYMHWWSLGKTDEQIKADARNSVIEATKLFYNVFNIKLASDSGVVINNDVSIFLEKINNKTEMGQFDR